MLGTRDIPPCSDLPANIGPQDRTVLFRQADGEILSGHLVYCRCNKVDDDFPVLAFPAKPGQFFPDVCTDRLEEPFDALKPEPAGFDGSRCEGDILEVLALGACFVNAFLSGLVRPVIGLVRSGLQRPASRIARSRHCSRPAFASISCIRASEESGSVIVIYGPSLWHSLIPTASWTNLLKPFDPAGFPSGPGISMMSGQSCSSRTFSTYRGPYRQRMLVMMMMAQSGSRSASSIA